MNDLTREDVARLREKLDERIWGQLINAVPVQRDTLAALLALAEAVAGARESLTYCGECDLDGAQNGKPCEWCKGGGFFLELPCDSDGRLLRVEGE